MPPPTTPRYEIVRLAELPPNQCACGTTRRAFVNHASRSVSLHVLDVKKDAQLHYHRQLTEVYYILSGEGEMELDGERHPVSPGDAVLIQPGCRHRAIGELKLLNIVVPAFDPADECFD